MPSKNEILLPALQETKEFQVLGSLDGMHLRAFVTNSVTTNRSREGATSA